MRIHVSILVIAALVSASRAADFDFRGFESLPAERKLAVVTGALEWREQQLQNFAYEAEETITIEAGLFRRSKLGYSRKGDVALFHCKHLETMQKAPLSEFWLRWDGAVQRSFTKRGDRMSGIITNVEGKFLAEVFYNDALGVRFPDFPMTVPQWLNAVTKGNLVGKPVQAQIAIDSGTRLIKICIESWPNHHDCYHLDPERDFMIVRHEMDHFFPKLNDSSRIDTTVTKAAKVDGLWVPVDVRRLTMLYVSKGGREEYAYHVTSFVRNRVEDKDLVVEFPVGAHVLDDVAKLNYFIEKDGGMKRGMYFDRLTGQVFGPDGRLLTKPTTRGATRPADGP